MYPNGHKTCFNADGVSCWSSEARAHKIEHSKFVADTGTGIWHHDTAIRVTTSDESEWSIDGKLESVAGLLANTDKSTKPQHHSYYSKQGLFDVCTISIMQCSMSIKDLYPFICKLQTA